MPRFLGVVLVGAVVLASSDWRVGAAGTITGVVFEDFNGNGARDTTTTVPSSGAGNTSLAVDRGIGGVTVTVYDSSGTPRGTVPTLANGSYSLSATGTGPYRVEFTNLPAGYRPSAFASGAAGNDTTVQFVPDGNSSNVNLGILDGASFCQNNPTLVTSCFVYGDQVGGAFNTNPAVIDFPYAAGSNDANAANYRLPATHPLMVAANQTGSVYGLAYAQRTNTVYAGAFMKKHSGFGPGGTGAIYAINPTTGATSVFADLNAIFGANTAGANPHNNADYNVDNGNASWDAVGKVALGGVEVSADGATLYALNLADRQLYALPTTGPLTSLTVRRASIPLNAPGATGVGGADLRPFALQWYRGQLYVGIVNSAQTTGLRSDLIAYIYSADPATLAFSAAPITQFSLVYPRGAIQTFSGTGPGEWQAWRTTFASQSPSGTGTYPQPMLSGFAFDAAGNVTLGIRDRAGDQFGFFAQDNPSVATLWEGVAGGDTLFAAAITPGNPAAGWTLESNAQAGAFGPTAGANNGEGPGPGPGPTTGFGEYYFADAFGGTHRELSGGALLQLPGHPDVVSTAFDPGLTVRTGGFVWLSETAGSRTKGYEVYNTGFGGPPQPTFSKANGFGELVAICQAAPIEIGNRVWDDVDGDGVQDPGEAALDGVTVELVAPGGAVIGTAITANGGQYFFSSGAGTPAGNAVYNIAGLTPNTTGYAIRIATAQGSLGGRTITAANNDASANGDSRDSDGTISGAYAQVTFATGAAGANDHTFDFGFTTVVPTLSLGNFVWFDTNNDGAVSAGETGLDGVTVRLLNAAGTTVLATQTTTGGGFYLFTGLAAGDYGVEVVTPAGFVSSSGGGTEPASDPDNDINSDDNGTTSGAVVRSLPVTLSLGGEPVNDGDADPNSNLTVDFGFVPTGLSLGNLVWLDTNNNGIADPGEPGIPGVTMRLIAADGVTVLATTTTNASGLYLFAGLAPGTYYVEVDRTSSGVTGYVSSTDIATSGNPNNDVNNDDNGVAITATTVRSGPVTLTTLGEPINDGDADPNSNLSVDFGFVRAMSLGNLIWADTNDNGRVDPGETGIAGVTVRLIAADGVTVLATTATDATGHYLFSGLPPGSYYVEVVPPSGSRSSTDIPSSANPDNDTDNDDNGVNLNGGVVRSGPITLTLGGEPINDGDTNPDSNLTVDFGFVPAQAGGGDADMCLLQTVPASVSPGGQMSSTYTAVNRGPATASNVMIEGMIPAGTTLVSATPSAGGVCSVASGTLDCTWPGLTPAGAAGDRTVTVVLQANAGLPAGTTIWSWFMTMASNSEPYPSNNAVDSYVFVAGGATAPVDLVMTGTARFGSQSGTAVAAGIGQPVSVRFAVTNAGTAAARGQYALLLDDVGVLTVTGATVSQGGVGASSATAGTWDTGAIAPGATATLDLTVSPASGTAAKIQAIRITGTPVDPNATNDSAEVSIDGLGPGGGRVVAVGNIDGVAGGEIITGGGAGETPQVQVFSGTGAPGRAFYAFDRAFRGGVRLAACDVNADGIDELIAAQGPGGGRVRVLSLTGGAVTELVAFDAFESAFTGGVNVACGDLDGDGRAEVVVGPEGGRAPDVRVFTVGAASALATAQFQAYEPAFRGGVRVSAARFTGSGVVGAFNVATMPGAGRATDLRLWQVAGASASAVATAPLFGITTGARVVLGDVNGDGGLDLLLLPDTGSPVLVQAYALTTGALVLNAPAGTGGYTNIYAAIGRLSGGPEFVVGSGSGVAPAVNTFLISPGGAVSPRLALKVLEQP